MTTDTRRSDGDSALSFKTNWRAIMWIAYLGAIVGALYAYRAL